MREKKTPELKIGKAELAVILVLLLVTLLVTANALKGQFILDDDSKIVHNTDIRILGELPQKLVYPYQKNQLLERNDPSRPLVFLLYALVYHFWQLNPLPYHLVNALFHFGCGALVFLLSQLLIFYLTGKRKIIIPLLTSLLFLITPIQMGTVIYAYSLSDILSSFLILLSLYLFVRRPDPGWAALLGSFLVFILGLFSKQSAVITPALIWLFDFAIIGKMKFENLKGRWKYYLIFVLIIAAYFLYRYLYFGAIGDIEGRGNTHPLLTYIFSEGVIILKYLFSTLIPYHLSIDHYLLPKNFTVEVKFFSWLFLLIGILFPLFIGLKSKTLRGRTVFFGILFYLVCLVPVTLMPTVDIMVERRVYLANFGFFLLWLALIDYLLELDFFKDGYKKVALGLVLLQIFSYTAVSLQRNRIYSKNENAWQDVLKIYPYSERATNNLANVYMDAKQYDKALPMFESLISRNPNDWTALHNLGSIYGKEDGPYYNSQKAIELFKKSIAANPDYDAAYYNLAREYQKANRDKEAIDAYLKCLKLNPNYILAHNNLGLIYYHQGKMEEAKKEYEIALKLDPNCGPAKFNLELLKKGPPPPGIKPNYNAPASSQPTPMAMPQAAPTEEPSGGGESAGHPVPASQVPPDMLLQLYEQALQRDPNNKIIRQKYEELKKQTGK